MRRDTGPEVFILPQPISVPFTRVDEVPVQQLAKFDGTSWSAVGIDTLLTPTSPIPPSLIGSTVWGVASVFDPATLTPLGASSGIKSCTLQ